MATTTRTASARQPLARPRPGPAPTASTRRDYTQPPPGGTHYPWEPGGGSKIPGVPDNWSDFYPNEGEGRGDAWIGPKKAQLNKEHPPGSYPIAPHGKGGPAIFGGMDPHAWQPGEVHDNGSPTPNWPDLAIARQQKLNQGYVDAGGTRAGWSKGGPIKGTPQPNPRPSGPLTYTPGGPIPPAAGGPGAPGAAPTGTTAGVKGKTQAPATNDQLGKWFGTMKPGASMTLQGKKYFKNQNGAVVDVTNPAARKRITNQQGAFIGQAAAPPPPAATTQSTGLSAPLGQTAAPSAVDPQQFAQMQQQFQQMQQMMQQYQQGGGGGYGGGYGGEQTYSGMPAQFSGFGNALMQGMGGGYGMPSAMSNYGGGYGDPFGGMGGYGMPMNYSMESSYGTPQQFSQGMMGGYGDPYGGMGGMMDQMMGYNSGMGGYGAPGMGYY